MRTQNFSEQNQKHFLCPDPGHKICIRNKCCARGQTGKHFCRQQCVRNNVSSFPGAFKALVNKDTLLPMMFLGLRKLGNICCGHRMFLNKIRNIFCVPDTKCKSATNIVRAGKRGNICVSNNVSATVCPRLPGPLRHCYTDYSNHFDFVSRKKLFTMSKNSLRSVIAFKIADCMGEGVNSYFLFSLGSRHSSHFSLYTSATLFKIKLKKCII